MNTSQIRILWISAITIIVVLSSVLTSSGCGTCGGSSYFSEVCTSESNQASISIENGLPTASTGATYVYSCTGQTGTWAEPDTYLSHCFDPTTSTDNWNSQFWSVYFTVPDLMAGAGCTGQTLEIELEFSLNDFGAPEASTTYTLDEKVISSSKYYDSGMLAIQHYKVSSGEMVAVQVSKDVMSFELRSLLLTKVSSEDDTETDVCGEPESITINEASGICVPEVITTPGC